MDLNKLKEQIEFYFSDSNYSKDKFMNARAAENDGYIPITALLTFKRLQALNATVDSIKEAVKESKVVEIKDDSLKKIKTQEFLDYLNDTEVTKRVVYIKGFPTDMTLDEVREMLSKFFTPVKITLRRDQNKSFQGSCFVELESKEKAEEVLNMKIESPIQQSEKENDSVKKLKTESGYLEIISREAYYSTHNKTKEEKKEDAFSNRVKENFIPRLYNLEASRELDIKEVKDVIPNTAFVDTVKKVVRMKFIEEWAEKEFEIPKSDDKSAVTIRLVKMNEEQARDYLKNISIKKKGKRN